PHARGDPRLPPRTRPVAKAERPRPHARSRSPLSQLPQPCEPLRSRRRRRPLPPLRQFRRRLRGGVRAAYAVDFRISIFDSDAVGGRRQELRSWTDSDSVRPTARLMIDATSVTIENRNSKIENPPLSLPDLASWSFSGTALAVLGQPIKPSVSPALHTAALADMAAPGPRVWVWRYVRLER